MDRSRQAAFEILLAVEKDGAYSNIAANKTIERLRPEQPYLTRELVRGVLAWKGRLDFILDQLAASGAARIKLREKLLLRMGLYQLMMMDDVPAYAAVSQTTELAKRVCRGREGFVNGVLRTYIKKRDALAEPPADDLRTRLSLSYSFPLWLCDLWLAQFRAEECEALMKASNERAPLTIRANLLRTDVQTLAGKLAAEGVVTKKGRLAESALTVVSGRGLTETQSYKEGLFSIQDEASLLAAEMTGASEGETVIDTCAAPGGKTAAMAEMMGNVGRIIACDVYEHKLKLIEEQAKRLGIGIIETRLQDGTSLVPALQEQADVVLADAPCSGLGVIRRKPEIKYRPAEDLEAILSLQAQILRNAAAYVKKGGTLVYGTCTINEAENQGQIKDFVENHREFEIIYNKQFLPTEGADGFYVCKMIKKG